MTNRKIISSHNAPEAIGTYSQAIKIENIVYLSGQIPLDPKTMKLVGSEFREQAIQVFTNLQSVCQASGGDLADIVKLTIYLVEMDNFPLVNQVMEERFVEPYPARAVIGVQSLPKHAQIEVDAILHLDESARL